MFGQGAAGRGHRAHIDQEPREEEIYTPRAFQALTTTRGAVHHSLTVTDPLISIVMPTFNRVAYLRAAVDSVVSQTFQDWELILADDGSDAETLTCLRTFESLPRVRVLRLEHTGNPPVVRNAAIHEARGKYIAFLDSDDLWLPNKLSVQMTSLQRHPTLQWSVTRSVMVDGDQPDLARARPIQHVSAEQPVLDQILKADASIAQSSVVASRASLAEVGGYPEDLPVCGDYELWVRLAVRSEPDIVDETLALVRRHTQHHSSDLVALLDLQRFLERTRSSGIAPHLDAVLRARVASVSAGIARNYAITKDRKNVLRTVLSSAPRAFRYRDWRRITAKALVLAFAPSPLVEIMRKHRRHGCGAPGRG